MCGFNPNMRNHEITEHASSVPFSYSWVEKNVHLSWMNGKLSVNPRGVLSTCNLFLLLGKKQFVLVFEKKLVDVRPSVESVKFRVLWYTLRRSRQISVQKVINNAVENAIIQNFLLVAQKFHFYELCHLLIVLGLSNANPNPPKFLTKKKVSLSTCPKKPGYIRRAVFEATDRSGMTAEKNFRCKKLNLNWNRFKKTKKLNFFIPLKWLKTFGKNSLKISIDSCQTPPF